MSIGQFAGVLGASVALVVAAAPDARACGGCFAPTQSGTVITDHRMIFSVSTAETTLYDQVQYSGSPSSFAWVLPIHGQVTVGLSSDLVFSALEQTTATTIVPPPLRCPCNTPGSESASSAPGAGSGGSSGGVTVLSHAVVGPYDTVQLRSSDPNALNAWLVANSYDIPSAVQPVIAAYVAEGFDFLAMRLAPDQSVSAMRPVSVTSAGAGVSLPLRMVAAGTGATVGVTLWVIGSGRYAPQNFQSFTISTSELVWDWSTGASNYTTVRTQKEGALHNRAWQIESSIDVSPTQVEQLVLSGGGGGGFGGSSGGGISQDVAASGYIDVPASDGGVGMTSDQARQQDLATLFPTGGASVRITRMRADLSQAALANDLVLQASSIQDTLSNVYQVTASVNAQSQCPSCPSGGGGSLFSCAASPMEPAGAGAGVALALAGIVGIWLGRARTLGSKQRGHASAGR